MKNMMPKAMKKKMDDEADEMEMMKPNAKIRRKLAQNSKNKTAVLKRPSGKSSSAARK